MAEEHAAIVSLQTLHAWIALEELRDAPVVLLVQTLDARRCLDDARAWAAAHRLGSARFVSSVTVVLRVWWMVPGSDWSDDWLVPQL